MNSVSQLESRMIPARIASNTTKIMMPRRADVRARSASHQFLGLMPR